MKKGKISILIFLALVVLIIGIFFGYKNIKKNTKEKKNEVIKEEFNGFNFKTVEKLNYDDYSIYNFIEEEIKCEEKCVYQNEIVEYNITEYEGLGKQKVTVDIKYMDKTYSKEYEIEIVDTEKPNIILSAEKIQIKQNDKFDILDYVVGVTDNYDENIIENLDIKSDVDTTKEGEYNVTLTVSDSSNNTIEKNVKVVVLKEVTEKTKTKDEVKKDEVINNKSNNNKSNTNQTIKKSNTNTSGVSNNSLKASINKIKLQPLKTRYTELDNQVDKILNKINNSSMDNYTKLYNIYHYVINTLEYSIPVVDVKKADDLKKKYHYEAYDLERILLAKMALDSKSGTCDSFAALFMVLTRRAGFESYVVNGQIKHADGKKTGHGWNVIKIDGKFYLFDTEAEYEYGVKDHYFAKTYKERNVYTTNQDAYIKAFTNFREMKPFKSTYTFSGGINNQVSFSNYTDETKTGVGSLIIENNNKVNMNFKLEGSGRYMLDIKINGKAIYYPGTVYTDSNYNYTYTIPAPGQYTIAINILDRDKGIYNSYLYRIDASSKYPLTELKIEQKDYGDTLCLNYIPTGGQGKITYYSYVYETDDESKEIERFKKVYLSSSANSGCITVKKGKYYKIRVEANDANNNKVTKELTIQK